ncbi:hypothetical protein QTI51_24895 [Variovorax sp. J22G73]|jgi:hypothetical protein|uniref:hypothetical protein n=1 Tax=unclassified Variovorax TaxID=663243 RepID=UPI000D5DC4CA|nr:MULTISPECIES: hypothetical protein [unclassified Variovorax]MDM0007839.1 hypothetical protein [Variovorax sp. J22R203]MDM0100538.1 hypothetical protein [Variovorax sp. J22G73]
MVSPMFHADAKAVLFEFTQGFRKRMEVLEWKFFASHCEDKGYIPAEEVIAGKKTNQR